MKAKNKFAIIQQWANAKPLKIFTQNDGEYVSTKNFDYAKRRLTKDAMKIFTRNDGEYVSTKNFDYDQR